MLDRWVPATTERAWVTLVVAVAVGVLASIVGADLMDRMTGEVANPNSPSARAVAQVTQAARVPPHHDDLVLVVRDTDADTAGPAPAGVGDIVTRLGRIPGVTGIAAPAAQSAELRAADGSSALVLAQIAADADRAGAADATRAAFASDGDITVGGRAIVDLELDETIGADLARAELIAFPLLLVLSCWIFRGVVAAVIPMLIGGLAVITTIAALAVITRVLPVSQYVMNLVLGLGMGLAIDYTLFIVSRYREEVLRYGYGRQAAIVAGLRAGKAVVLSAATVAIAMVSLLIFPQQFLYSMGLGGVIVTVSAAAAAVLVVPAALTLLGARVDSLALPAWHRARQQESADASVGRWYRLSRLVMRHPGVSLLLGLAVVGTLTSSAFNVRFSDVDASALPLDSKARVVAEVIAGDYPQLAGTEVFIAASAPATAHEDVAGLYREADRFQGVAFSAPQYLGSDTWLSRGLIESDAFSDEAEGVVNGIRAEPSRLTFAVGGDAAAFVDLEDEIAQRLPYALGMVAAVVLLVMFALTGSVTLSVKTVILNVFNVAMTFGVLVWVFQEGHFEQLLDFTSTGRIDLTQPLLVAIIAFGLSTDYGVFLFARIKEAHDAGHDDCEAVAPGTRSQRSHHHQCRAAARGRGGRVLHVQHLVHQTARGGRCRRCRSGRHPGSCRARSGCHGADGHGELVGAGLAARVALAVRAAS